MLTPSIFGENLFDDWFDDFPFFDDRDLRKVDKKLYGRRAGNLMKTDIQEMKDGYKMEVDLPGFKKDEIAVELDDGYLTISAAKGLDQDEKEKESGRYIRRERYAGACSRSFYVGEGVTEEDIKACLLYTSGCDRCGGDCCGCCDRGSLCAGWSRCGRLSHQYRLLRSSKRWRGQWL